MMTYKQTFLVDDQCVVNILDNNNDLLAITILDDSAYTIRRLSLKYQYKFIPNSTKQTFEYDYTEVDKYLIAYRLNTMIYNVDNRHDGNCTFKSYKCKLCELTEHYKRANQFLTQFKSLRSDLTIIDIVAAILNYEKYGMQWEYFFQKDIKILKELNEYYNQSHNAEKVLAAYNDLDNNTRQKCIDRAISFYKNVVDRIIIADIL